MRAVMLWLWMGLFSWQAAAEGLMEVRYISDAPRYQEYIELLRMALDKTVPEYGPYAMRHPAEEMNEPRFMAEAVSGQRVNLVWGATSEERERKLIPIRIPLGKGLLGYRVGLIRAGDQARFSGVRTVDDLKEFSFGLGPGWGDIPIYRHAGLTIWIDPYEKLFKMLAAGRFDFYSRGVNEVFTEYQAFQLAKQGIVIEQDLLLYYPYPFYFFVSPSSPRLASRLTAGLERMLNDGSFDAIFWRYNRSSIEQAGLARRRIVRLVNPALPAHTPLGDRRLWFVP
ncbi:amino acid ABC transporter substrate-binding protein [Chromobacterium phragmitis]|uniref:Amino acid ABC transporter substrate-binding protein n=1 Tax=Chromobacterium phragmitis TaxID=2202141 RepID=A0A344UI98_9NEIS|nr:amino acid ABC transporter substrate-binding protein [Chromobacterium phragmitis]AXE29606.1 amino acid ABC transporter substrate-binding protein [Chromobacterium phragmitis]AXE34996.1 amino acid ABC transporter substrate-binding protein [Chromobacterium phragmitis]